ncbi:MAG: tRNA-(ms[2]io[6]A)-hydroxylase [Deltaproteobacteria bacterium]|nr:tRNA-(ms[2]io[6]A)-hydroxylase [Deltaproteobacteria bacterium]
MLHLASRTDPRWVARVSVDLDELLIDHAHCEKKAASTAVSLLFRYPERGVLLAPLSSLAREELAHFELLLSHLERRGVAFRRLRPSPYAGKLLSAVRPEEPSRLLDTLLCLSLIEARSCERMQLLAEGLADSSLRGLYEELLASEARHHRTYVELAEEIGSLASVRSRLEELAGWEAAVLAGVPKMARMHA